MKWLTHIVAGGVHAIFGLVWVLLLVLSALQLGPVRKHLLRFALEQVDGAIAGSIRVAELRGDLLTHGTLVGIELLDPQGRSVATVAQLELRYRPAALMEGTLHLETVAVKSPAIQAGDALTAALGSLPSEPKGEAPPLDLRIRIDEFSLTGGTVTMETASHPVAIRGIEVAASVDFLLAKATGFLRLERTCMSVSSLKAPLCLEAEAKHVASSLEASLRATSGDQRLQLSIAAELAGTPHGSGRLVVEHLQLLPLVPGIQGTPLAQPVDVDLQLTMAVESPDRISGSVDFSRLAVLGLDLSGLHVTATREASGIAARVELPRPGDGRVVADATWSEQSRRGTVKLVATGLELEPYRHLVPELEKASAFLDSFLVVGMVDLAADQPHWQANVAFAARDLAWQDTRIEDLAGEAALSGVGASAAAGHASLTAGLVQVGETRVEEACLTVHRTLPGRTLLAASARLEEVTGRVALAVDWPVFKDLPDQVEIVQIEADYRGHVIRNATAAKVKVSGFTTVGLSPLRMMHAVGEVEVGGRYGLETGEIDALVRVDDLDLGELLEVLEQPAVGGLLSGKARLHGSLAAPLFEAELHLREPANEWAPFVTRLDARTTYDGRQVTAEAAAHFRGNGTLTADAQAPLTLALDPFIIAQEGGEAVHGKIVLAGFELSLLRDLLPAIPINGTAGLQLDFAGPLGLLDLALDARVHDLSVPGARPLDFSIQGSMSADALSVHADMEWPESNAVALAIEAPRFRLMPVPEPFFDWFSRWTGDHRLTITADRLLLGQVLADWKQGGLASASVILRPLAGVGRLEYTASADFQPGVQVRPQVRESTGTVQNQATAVGSFDVLQSMVQADGRVQNLQLRDFAKLFMADKLAGQVDGTWSVAGSLQAPKIVAALDVSRLDVPGARFIESGRVTLAVQSPSARLSARVDLREGGHVRLAGELPLELSFRPFRAELGMASVNLRTTLEDVAVENFESLWGPGIDLGGYLAGTVRLHGAVNRPDVTAHLEALGLKLPGYDPLDVTLDATMDPRTAGLEVRVARGDQIWAQVEGKVPAWRLPDDTAARWIKRWDSDSHYLTLDLENVPLGGIWPDWQGGGQVTLTGRVTKPPAEFELAMSAAGMTVLGRSVSLTVAASATQELVKTSVNLMADDDSVATLEGSLGKVGGGPWLNAPLSAPLHLAFDVTEGARILLALLGKELDVALDGPVAVKGSVDGSIEDLRVEAEVDIEQIRVKGVAVDRVRVTALINERGGQATLDVRAGAASVEASVAMESPCLHQVVGQECDVQKAPVRGNLTVLGLEEELVTQFLPRGYLVEFSAGGTLELAGTVEDPRVTGGLTVDVERLKVPIAGWDTGNIQVKVLADGSRITLQPVVLVVDDGSATLQGFYDLATTDLSLLLQLEHFLAVNRPSMDVRVEGEMGVRGTLERPEIYGEIVVPEAHVGGILMDAADLHPMELHEDIAYEKETLGGRDPLLALLLGPVDSGQPGEPKRKSVREVTGKLHIRIPGRFFVDAPIAELELAGDLTVLFEKMRPSIVGEVHTHRGRVDIFGRLFDVERAQVTFTGSRDNDPRLDVVANFSISRVDLSPYGFVAGPESAITVALSGRVSDPKVALSSTPPMAEEQIMAILVMGRARGGEEQATAGGAALVAGFLVGPLQSRLSQKLPVDTLNVRAGDKGFEDAQVSAGKYLATWLYLEYAYQFGAEEEENSNELHLELRLGRHILLETIYGDAGAGSADVIYRIRY